jgi:murein DD-endopeptidase MepM/ murein hydrolase activator NlpD
LIIISLAMAGCALPHWPVEGTLSSPFGLRRDGLQLQIHRGVDIAVAPGTPVRAMAAGQVAFAGSLRGYGLVVMIDHSPRLRTVYAHLSEIRVRLGDRVSGHSVIALAGASGRVSAPHLHFEIRRRGHPVDPVPLLGRPPRPHDP